MYVLILFLTIEALTITNKARTIEKVIEMHIAAILFFLILGSFVINGFRQALQPLSQYLLKTAHYRQKPRNLHIVYTQY